MSKQYDIGDISKLLDIMTRLRDPAAGCPWDLAQDFDSIAPYTIEEAYEVADCIERGALDELPDELGDLLLQVVFHAQLGKDRGLFSFTEVVERICSKMIRRHPHVFGAAEALDSEAVAQSWEAIKRREQPAAQTLMDRVALGLPALSRAHKLGRRASSVGFDWRDLAPVRAKLDEELAELDEAINAGQADRIEAEIGDLLFSAVNLCRHLEIDPERALRRTNARFVRRFNRIEAQVREAGGDWASFDEATLDAMWGSAKAAEGD